MEHMKYTKINTIRKFPAIRYVHVYICESINCETQKNSQFAIIDTRNYKTRPTVSGHHGICEVKLEYSCKCKFQAVF